MTEVQTLRQLRVARGLTQQEAADGCGVIQASYSMWENGHSLPTTDKLPRIGKALGADMNTLVPALLAPATEGRGKNDAQTA